MLIVMIKPERSKINCSFNKLFGKSARLVYSENPPRLYIRKIGHACIFGKSATLVY